MIQKPDDMTEEQFEAHKAEVIKGIEIQYQYAKDIGGDEFLEFYKAIPNCKVQNQVAYAWAKMINEFRIPEIPGRPISRLIDRSFINGVFHGWKCGQTKN